MATLLIEVADTSRPVSESEAERLERGAIFVFPNGGISLPPADCEFLLTQHQAGAGYHKNVAYRPAENRMTGTARGADLERLLAIMARYCREASALVGRLLPRYATGWRLDYGSYRSQEEAGRDLSLHARNDLVHFDAFPTRPTHGARILRFFTNVNPAQGRVWVTSDNFETTAERFARDPALDSTLRQPALPFRILSPALAAAGVASARRSPYDRFMLKFHHYLKEDEAFQRTCAKTRTEFPPGSSWLVFTDAVSHSVLSGQYALEQTFIVSRDALYCREAAPASILERICGHAVTR